MKTVTQIVTAAALLGSTFFRDGKWHPGKFKILDEAEKAAEEIRSALEAETGGGETVAGQAGCPNVNCSPEACPCYPAMRKELERLREATNRKKVGQPYLVTGLSPRPVSRHGRRTVMAKTKTTICKHCREGHRPKVLSNGSVEHWIVRSIFPARINIVACKEPDAHRLALSQDPAGER